ncbi:iron reductase [Lentinus tigrinus ALCF2SS1-6]|uniref:ferric-chelate reductase (NADPH) n=1 Tax=Lentinus tigrinus ALCF2SS1-6 TaxID=1328759 RepID=A0A5C2RS02_9APHY|nr:iron reductase [Lentinus tigrinus ALCF2SS1-6]
MSDFGAPPVIPTALQQYNSYVEDPKWQRKFSIVWAAGVGIAVLASVPHVARALKNGRLFRGLFTGVSDSGSRYTPTNGVDIKPPRSKRRVLGIVETLWSSTLWTLPGVELDLGQRFLALAQFPVVFLFATKNSILSLLLGPGNGYEKLNYIHRWAGRGMFIGATVHGALWINNHVVYGLPILGQQKETSGVAAFGVLCVLVLTSFRPIRRFFYQWFFVVHVLGFVAFYITVCYHTIYASPWIFPPLAFYGFDMLLRMFRYRIKDATLVPVDSNMTLIHVHDCADGWVAGQHVRLRVFFSGRIFESHPLTIVNAPAASSCVPGNTITLAARVVGDWTRAINTYASKEQERLRVEKDEQPGVPVHVMIDGPYGGSRIDVGEYESALLIAGGSGVTFTLGLLDDIVARCVKLGRAHGEKTRRIEFAWCVRSYGAIHWFAPMLMEIANAVAGTSLDLHISVYVTCLCNPEEVPPIPNMDVVATTRPSVTGILRDLVTPPAPTLGKRDLDVDTKSLEMQSDENAPGFSASSRLNWVGLGGGVAVCAAGPESLTREAHNAVARVSLTQGVELGGIALHTELFAI